MTVKPVAKLEEWSFYIVTEGALVLKGKIRNHPRQEYFNEEWQGTSLVLKFFMIDFEWFVETENTVYLLGEYVG